jgi:hypothetical protein
MGISDLPAGGTTVEAQRGRFALLATFTAAIFVSAALLFVVQPMFTKMVLPRLGGAPSVWSVAIVFFQAALLAGYAYAHLLTRFAPGRTSVIIHVVVMLIACLALPLSIAAAWGRPPAVGEALWLIGLFIASIGLPFFALSANGPLLQAWFARTDHPAAKDPYFLYVASNIGSFLALVSYPLAIEPLVRLGDQARLWSAGFYVLIALIVGCGVLLWRSADKPPSAATEGVAEAAPPTWRDAATWVTLAAVPSGLLVAVTAHISTDVAAVPLLWVLPLALYLLTFVIVFQRRPIIPHWLVVEVQPIFLLGLIAVTLYTPFETIVSIIALHLVVFFVSVLMCHGELARRRPAPRYLTGFYLWMAAGGVIGGIAAALVAPRLFNWVAEYPILLALTVLCRPGLALPTESRNRYLLLGAIAAAALALILLARYPDAIEDRLFQTAIGALLVASVLFWQSPLSFAVIVAFVLIANHIFYDQSIMTLRSFFGVHKITETPDGRFRLLTHGTTLHGGQRIYSDEGQPLEGRPEPLLYYYDNSAIAQAIDAVRSRVGGPIRYAVIGLGSGSLACRAEPADTVHYYEIDPTSIRIARDPKLFTFLSECGSNVQITLGDARLTLADAPAGAYDLVIVDAFSSDAIPIHLLTREAMAIYRHKVGAHGMVVIHVSNRHLELASVVAGIAAANGLMTRVLDEVDLDETAHPYKFSGTIAAVAKSDEDFGALAQASDWVLKESDPNQWVWTDDYSNIVGSLMRRLKE